MRVLHQAALVAVMSVVPLVAVLLLELILLFEEEE
jgi:hypothetical protein